MTDTDPITRLNAALEGRYHIERELGEGGMATVYLADDIKHAPLRRLATDHSLERGVAWDYARYGRPDVVFNGLARWSAK